MTRLSSTLAAFALCAPCALAQSTDVAFQGTVAIGDQVGFSADMDGDRAVLSGPQDVFVYRLVAGAWQLEQELFPSTTGNQNLIQLAFGGQVAINGSTIFVGAFGANLFAEGGGSVFVYELQGGVWSETAILSSSDIDEGDAFGTGLSSEGDTLVVGAAGEDAPGMPQGTGAAYVFRETPNGWVEEAKLTAPDGGVNDTFGSDVVYQAGRVCVTAPFDNVAGDLDRGSAYVFERTGVTWSFITKLQASDGAEDDWFGAAVDMDDGRVVLGAPENMASSNDRRGAAYVYEADQNGVWSEVQKVSAQNSSERDHFGSGVALQDGLLVVGAWGDNFGGQVDIGSVHVFRCEDDAFAFSQLFFASNVVLGQRFGKRVHLEDGELLVTAAFSDTFPVLNGAVYAFTLAAPAVGSPTCAGQPNSTGGAAALAAFGRDVATENEIVMEATGLPPYEPGYLLASQSSGFIANPGGSQGNLCLGGGFARFVDIVLDGGEAGHACRRVDLTDIPTNPTSVVLAGETWQFQWWYRDRNPLPTSNFSGGAQVVFQ